MANGIAQNDPSVIQQGLASAGLPSLPQLFQQQQAGIFGGGAGAQQQAGLLSDPPGFLERRGFGSGRKQKERIQKQRVKDARALGDLARSQGIETGPGLGQGIATQLQSSFGAQGAAQLLAEREKQLPANVAEEQRLLREQRKQTQREGLQFAQETNNRELEAQIKAQTLAKGALDIDATTFDQRFRESTGFDNPADMVDTSLTISTTNEALGSLDSMIKIREDLGAIGPLDFMANPEAAAAVKNFQKFESVNLFKQLADDTRLSDEDREFYGSIVELSAADLLFSGGKVELAQLKDIQRRLENTMQTYEFGFPALAERRPELFSRKNFDDIGAPFQSTTIADMTPEQQAELGLSPGPFGPVGAPPLGGLATGR